MDKRRILIIESDENIRTSLVRVLNEPTKYVILTAPNIEEANLLIGAQEIDLVICDHKVGPVDGVQYLRDITEARPKIIALLLTTRELLELAVDAVNKSKILRYFVRPWDNKTLRAIVSSSLDGIDKEAKLKGITASDIMSKFAITIKEDMLLLSAAHLMMRFKISGMPVMSTDEKIVGIITATDLFRIMGDGLGVSGSEGNNFARHECSFVREVMTKGVVTVKKDAPFSEIVGIMVNNNIHTMPVVESGELVGIIGRRDVINTYYSLLGCPEE